MQSNPDFILTKRGERLHLRFLSKRVGTVIGLLLLTCFLVLPATLMTMHGTDGQILSPIWGGTLSFVLTSWWVIVPMVARVEITIEPDIIRMQHTWFRIPIGVPHIYARNSLSDLGAYFRGGHGHGGSTCVLSVWHNGKSITLERTFPRNGIRRLQWELTQHEVTFPITLTDESFELQEGGRIR